MLCPEEMVLLLLPPGPRKDLRMLTHATQSTGHPAHPASMACEGQPCGPMVWGPRHCILPLGPLQSHKCLCLQDD